MREWKITETNKGTIIIPSRVLHCVFCGEPLLLHDFICSKNFSFDFYHCDVHLKCPNCNWFVTFGVPITEEEYNKLVKSPLHHRILKWEIVDLVKEKDKEKIEERLKSFGYW